MKQLDNVYSYKDKLLLSKKREIFKNICKKRLDKIEEWSKKNNHDGLKFTVQSSGQEVDFSRIEERITFFIMLKKMKYW